MVHQLAKYQKEELQTIHREHYKKTSLKDKQIKDLQKQNETLKQKNNSLVQENQQLTDSISCLKNQLDDLIQENRDINDKDNQLRKRNEALQDLIYEQKELRQIRAQLVHAQLQIQEYEQMVKNLSDILNPTIKAQIGSKRRMGLPGEQARNENNGKSPQSGRQKYIVPEGLTGKKHLKKPVNDKSSSNEVSQFQTEDKDNQDQEFYKQQIEYNQRKQKPVQEKQQQKRNKKNAK
eukprot:403367617